MQFLRKYFFFILFGVVAVALIANHLYRKPRFVNGESAPDFTGYLVSGDSMRLSDLRGQYVLLDFWGSWCKPCREQSPELRRLYREYSDRDFKRAEGFEIVSVGVETNRQAWLRAIEKDSLYWPYHISDVQRFDDRVVQQYGVREIPTTYLLDTEGTIIAVNPSGERLGELLR